MSLPQYAIFSQRTPVSTLFRPWHVQRNTQHTHSHIILLWVSNNISLPSLVSLAQYPFLSWRTPMSKVNRLQHVQRCSLGRGPTKGSWFGTVYISPVTFAPLGPPVWSAGVTTYATCWRGANRLHVHNSGPVHPRATIDLAPCSARRTPSVYQIWCR